MPKEKILLFTVGILSVANILFIYASYIAVAGLVSILTAALLLFYIIISRRTKMVCGKQDKCPALEMEKEAAVSNLKSHLSEQKHDFLNVLQIVYGYTQLKKPEKVLSQIIAYSKKVENIGAIYNAKCIKLADLLYTKGKEAEIIDIQLHYDVKISFESVIRMLDEDSVLYAVDGIISNCFYAFHRAGLKNCNLVYDLCESESSFEMEVSFRDAQEGYSVELPDELEFAEEDMYWNKISRQVPGVENLREHCRKCGYELQLQTGVRLFKLKISKN